MDTSSFLSFLLWIMLCEHQSADISVRCSFHFPWGILADVVALFLDIWGTSFLWLLPLLAVSCSPFGWHPFLCEPIPPRLIEDLILISLLVTWGSFQILAGHLGWGKRGSKHVYVDTCAPVWRQSAPFPLVSLKDTGFLIEPGAHNLYGLTSKLQGSSSLCLPRADITGTHTWTCFVVVCLVWLLWVLFVSLFV